MWPLFLLVGLPVVIHLLVRAQAPSVDFPSLRFVRAARMRAVRRRLLTDPALLAIRVAILAVAVAAIANVIVAAAWRQPAWNARVARAIVIDARVAPAATQVARLESAFETTRIDTRDLADGVRRAQAWLASTPPARREIAIVSDFPLGSLDDQTLREVPARVGLQLVRATSGRPPSPVEVPMLRVLPQPATESHRALRVTTDQERTRVDALPGESSSAWRIDDAPEGVTLPSLALDLHGPPDTRGALRAAASAALSLDLPIAPDTDRRRVVVTTAGASLPAGRTLCAPWMGEVARAIATDADAAGLAGPRVSAEKNAAAAGGRDAAPWIVVRDDSEGAPLVRVAARRNDPCTLVIDARVPATSPLLPLLLRTALLARGGSPDFSAAEGLHIADSNLREWSRPAPEVRSTDLSDPAGDRRWWWLAALGLLGVEWWMRRSRRQASMDTLEAHEPAA